VRADVEPFFAHLGNLVLPLGDDHRHIGFLQSGDMRFDLPPGVALRPGHLRLQRRNLFAPKLLDLIVHADGRGLVDADHHGLALEAPPCEMRHQVLGHRLQPVVASDQVVLPGELPFQLLFLLLVQLGFFKEVFHVLVQVVVDQLQLRDAVFVVERDGRAVGHGLLEVIDADIIAEDLPCLFLAHDQGRAGEGQKGGVGQGRAHIERQGVVLAAVRFVGDDDDVGPFREHRMRFALLSAELVDQCEDVAVILAEQLPQVLAAFRLGVVFHHHPGRGEVLVDLAVQFLPVRDDHEGPVARQLAQHFLGEEHHRHALAAALGVPEHPQFAISLPDVGQGRERIVDAQVLVVLGREFDEPAGGLLKEAEVLHQIQKPRRVADAAQHRLQRHPALLVFAAHLLPFGEVLPAGGDAAHPALAAIR